MFYKNHPERLAPNSDPGDLSIPIANRKKLHCKSFKYYLENIAPGILERFPVDDRPAFASGAIQSLANKSICLDSTEPRSPASLRPCSSNLANPPPNQDFILNWHRMIKLNDSYDYCLLGDSITACYHGVKSEKFQYRLVKCDI